MVVAYFSRIVYCRNVRFPTFLYYEIASGGCELSEWYVVHWYTQYTLWTAFVFVFRCFCLFWFVVFIILLFLLCIMYDYYHHSPYKNAGKRLPVCIISMHLPIHSSTHTQCVFAAAAYINFILFQLFLGETVRFTNKNKCSQICSTFCLTPCANIVPTTQHNAQQNTRFFLKVKRVLYLFFFFFSLRSCI